jgi:hypothetical protein
MSVTGSYAPSSSLYRFLRDASLLYETRFEEVSEFAPNTYRKSTCSVSTFTWCVFSTDYVGDSVNGSQMDMKCKTCDI